MRTTDMDLRKQRIISEEEIRDKTCDFATKIIALYHLQSLTRKNPEIIDPGTVSTIQTLLKDPGFNRLRQGLLLFRHAAETLCLIITHSRGNPMAACALSALKNVLGTTTGHSHRATAEAIGALPFSIHGPEIKETGVTDAPCVNCRNVADQYGYKILDGPEFVGRSFFFTLNQDNKLLVFKLARPGDSPHTLYQEALWMEHLGNGHYTYPFRFNVPAAVKIGNDYVFRLMDIPDGLSGNTHIHIKSYAMGYIADHDYFAYPNDSRPEKRLTETEFQEVMFRNARLIGKLTSLGIVHTAPIPLFHNRVQTHRRRDRGYYEWFRGGRLDRWLDSCLFPNFGLTGIRDFEHLIAFKDENRLLYRHIGNHFLSLLLVTGSYFRNKNTGRVGFDKHGKPMDTRDLFNKQVLKETILGIFLNYYNGFAEIKFKGALPLDPDKLACRMIEEMGVDRHMEETLRVEDQNDMKDEAFRLFLTDKGYSITQAGNVQKGVEDIDIYTGPHLGGFNEPISLPELIEAVGTMSALCIAGRYYMSQSA